MTYPVPGGAEFLRARDNLSDLASAAAARVNLGLSENIVSVDAYGADPTGTADSTTAFQDALAALPTKTIYATPPSTGDSATYPYGTIYLGSGTYKIGSSADIGNLGPFVSLIGPGRNACTLSYYGSGDAIRMFSAVKPADDTFDDLEAFAGVLNGFTIDGTSAGGTAANGLHYGDFEGGVLGPDLWIQNFSQGTGLSGAKGIYFDNSVSWTENTYGRACLRNNTNAVYFDVTTGDTSFEYNDLTFKIYAWPDQNGIVLNHGATYSNGSLKIRGNFLTTDSTNTGAVLVFGTSSSPNNRIAYSRLDVQAETNGAGANPHQTINFTSAFFSIQYVTGTMIFGDTFAVSNYSQQYPLNFIGVISGDAVLAGASQFNPVTQPAFASGVAASSLGIRVAAVLPTATGSSGQLANEVLYFTRATAWYGGQITKLGTVITTVAATPGAGVNRLGVYSTAGVLLAQTGDMTSAFEALGYAEGTLGSPYDLVAGTDYLLAILTSFTTSPVLTRIGLNISTLPPFAGTEYITGYLGSQTTMPASFTPSSATGAGSMWCLYGR